MKPTKLVLASTLFVFAALPAAAFAQHHDLTHDEDATQDAIIQFGVNPNPAVPLGPPPCAQLLPGGLPNAAIGGPADPCQYKLHHMNGDTEVTIVKGGQVRFNFGGGGHALALYEVSKDTTRDNIGEDLCPGFDRIAPGPGLGAQPCNLDAVNANANHIISDGKGDVVIESGINNDPANAPPINQVSYEPGRLASDSAAGNATIDSYRFLKTGRYLVICKNRTHFLNDWMFTFVNVVGGD